MSLLPMKTCASMQATALIGEINEGGYLMQMGQRLGRCSLVTVQPEAVHQPRSMRNRMDSTAGRQHPDLKSISKFLRGSMRTKPHLRIKRGGKWGFDVPLMGISYRTKLALNKWCKERNIKERR